MQRVFEDQQVFIILIVMDHDYQKLSKDSLVLIIYKILLKINIKKGTTIGTKKFVFFK